MRAEKDVQGQAVGAGVRNLVDLLVLRGADAKAPAARMRVDGAWRSVPWGEVLADVQRVSEGLVALGVQPGDRVAVFAPTSYTYLVVDLAISAARGWVVPIYASSTADELHYILEHCGATALFVDGDTADGRQAGRLTRARARRGALPALRHTIAFDGPVQGPGEVSLATLREDGERRRAQAPRAFQERVAALAPEDTWGLIYTSGTTGHPKGVVLTHANWVYEAQSTTLIGDMTPADTVMLFLPLAHSFGQVTKAAWLYRGFEMILAQSLDTLGEDIATSGPTLLPAVPRVFEKVYAGVRTKGESQPGVKGALARWAFREFDAWADARVRGERYDGMGWALAKRVVFDKKVRPTLEERLGGRMRMFISGGAPLSRKVAYFFEMLGLVVYEGYGLTESAAGTTVNRPDGVKIGTVGRPYPGTEIRIAEDGEVLVRGPGIMKGYYKNDIATAEALDADGWLHTGDVGELDREGFLRITDRKKDLIVTAGGKNIPPQNLENALKAFPLVSQAMVHGDKRAYLTALLCVNEDAARRALAEAGATAPEGYAALRDVPQLRAAVQAVVDRVNAELPPYSQLKKFTLMDHDFTVESGDLTPSLKVKRKLCTQKYGALLDAMYDGQRVLD